jgi:DNA end-binding protein Ku
MPRAYWRGYLKLSLVTCAVELFPATTEANRAHFHRINRKNGHRLRQQMVDESTGRPVPKEQIGRGYELGKGSYVEIEDAELDAVKLESTRTIDIDSFVAWDEIDRRYLDKPYYMIPAGKGGEEAFAVVRDAMRDKGRVALGRVVLANREHILAIEPLGKGLLATTLRYPYEMRDEAPYFSSIKSPRVDKEMVRLASHILDSKGAHFDPSKFKDRYENALKSLVKRKAAGKTIEAPREDKKSAEVIDLFEALQRSLGRKAQQMKRASKSGKHGARKRKAA